MVWIVSMKQPRNMGKPWHRSFQCYKRTDTVCSAGFISNFLLLVRQRQTACIFLYKVEEKKTELKLNSFPAVLRQSRSVAVVKSSILTHYFDELYSAKKFMLVK
mmetsp:Transcript_23083/g.52175  ORF Transcript_23083/g.52175 Transcript_23083/m.52175 type:complete len:104 (-) Transcript_23083:87-398(-)